MKKTIEQLTKEFNELMNVNGFEPTGDINYLGNEIYSRKWERTSEVLWHGQVHSAYEIKATIYDGIPYIGLIENGRLQETRDYTSPKRMLNAIKEILRCAGYEF